ncbi:MAG: cytidine deaminase family protein [Thermoplasmata archaeon]
MTAGQGKIDDLTLEEMAKVAWEAREKAIVIGNTKVGAAVLSDRGGIFYGCNIEHRLRSHDIHAEVNAIGAMVAAGEKKLEAILVVAERENFLPCGACMDWIFELGGKECVVGFQSRKDGPIRLYLAEELMPHYPR